MTETVLITGGFGYLGGRIARGLAESGPYNLRLTSLEQPTVMPDWFKGQYIPADLNDRDALTTLCDGVNHIIHLAALNEIDSAADPDRALQITTLATARLVRAAEQAGVDRFLYFSTAHVYGAPLIGHINEQTVPRPVHPYAITHHAAEDYVLASHAQKKTQGIVVRLSNGIGSPIHGDVNRWTLLVNDLCRQAVTDRKLVLKTSGLQQRDFIAMADIIGAVRHFLELPAEECGDGLFNLGSGRAMTVYEMAQLIAGRCAAVQGFAPPVIRPEPGPEESSAPLFYSIDKLMKTGFMPADRLEDEIDDTLRLCQTAFGQTVRQ